MNIYIVLLVAYSEYATIRLHLSVVGSAFDDYQVCFILCIQKGGLNRDQIASLCIMCHV